MDISLILTSTIPVIVVVLGFIFEKERDRQTKLHERKEELYKNLVISLKGFFGDISNLNDLSEKIKFVDETRIARLYASDEAIEALNMFLDHIMKDEKSFQVINDQNYQKVAHTLLGEFIKAMRKDLGVKTKLSALKLGRTEKVNLQ